MKSFKSAIFISLVLILAFCFALAAACGDDDDDDDERGGIYTPADDDDDGNDDDANDDTDDDADDDLNDDIDDDIDDDVDDDADDDVDDDVDDDADDDADDDVDDDVDDDAEEVWEDASSGLMWQNASDRGYNWEEVKIYCENLDWGGYGDWRLPTISELRSLIRGCPATETGGSCGATDDCREADCGDDTCLGCELDQGPGSGGRYWPAELVGEGSRFWSSSSVTDVDYNAWSINFDNAAVLDGYYHPDYNSRCVRYLLSY